MPVDYHMHTPLCKHAEGEPEQYAEKAVERGIEEIGFSDHNPMPDWFDPTVRMSIDEFPGYLEMVERTRKAFEGKLTVRLGIEADYFPGTEAFVRDLLNRAEFDYVIGSVHYLGSWAFDNPNMAEEFSRRDINEVYVEYYAHVEQLAQTGLYDILGHPDVVKKFGHRPTRDLTANVRRALEAVRDAGMCMELNTSGLRKPCREIYPEASIVKLANEAGVPITFGSDSHEPGTVGADYDQAISMARDAGYSEFRRYRGRKHTVEKL